MEMKLRDGRYVLTAAGVPETVKGAEETLQRVLMRLTARRGEFWPDPAYGSRLWTLPRLRAGQRSAAAGQFVAEALADETGVEVEEVTYIPGSGDTAQVAVALRIGGARREITVAV